MIYNFSAGPSMMPVQVMKEAEKEFLNYHDMGMSVMELNHRSVAFNDIIDEAEEVLRKILQIPHPDPDSYTQGFAPSV